MHVAKYEIVRYFGNACVTESSHAREDEARNQWYDNDCNLSDSYRLFLRLYRKEGGIAYEETIKGYNC